MDIHANIKSKATSYDRLSAGIFGALLITTVLSGLIVANTRVSADNSTTYSSAVSVNVAASCTMESNVDDEHNRTITPTQYTDEIGTTSVYITCNNPEGYAVYAVGYGNNTWNDNTLTSTYGSINTADRASTTDSHWYMKITKPATSGITVENSYDSYKAIPGGSTAGENGYVKVVSQNATTTANTNADFQTTYGVYASASQTAGTYTGKVKYTLVNPHSAADENKPKSKDPGPCDLIEAEYCMQDVANWASSVTTGNSVTAVDARDSQEYSVTRLADGKLWMTTNLDLAGGTALSADDTDVTSEYISGFSTSNNLTKTGDTIVLPASSTSGFNTANYSYVYNTGNKTSNCASPGCYSYYSWDAATLGSGRSIAAENTDAQQSICPKNWRLPTSGNSSSNGWKRGDFYALATAYGANLESNYYENSATFYNNAGPDTIPNFLLAGRYYNGSFYDDGSSGLYWSATSRSSTSNARCLSFYSSYVSSANSGYRDYGFSVRCVASGS